MRETRLSGSVEGVISDGHSYSDYFLARQKRGRLFADTHYTHTRPGWGQENDPDPPIAWDRPARCAVSVDEWAIGAYLRLNTRRRTSGSNSSQTFPMARSRNPLALRHVVACQVVALGGSHAFSMTLLIVFPA